MLKEKYGTWALITGASSGIGEEFALQLAEHNFNLVLLARREDRLKALANKLEQQYGITTRIAVIDLAQADFMDKLRPQIADIEIGLLVNNAGFGSFSSFLDDSLDLQRDMIAVNITAPTILAYEMGQQMKQRGRGAIIFLSSVTGFQSVPYAANYAASKAHLLSLGESLAYEWRNQPIDVLTVCPGFTNTEGLNSIFDNLGANVNRPPLGDVKAVVSNSLKSLGRKDVTIPGISSKVLVFLTTRLFSRNRASKFMGKFSQNIGVQAV